MVPTVRLCLCAASWKHHSHDMKMKTGVSLTLLGLLRFLVLAVQQCSLEKGGGFCPEGNTCCLLEGGGSGCIPNDMGDYNATCCSDGLTGCAVNYTCGANQQCHATEGLRDPLVQVMPRYTLCHPTSNALKNVHGFPIAEDAKLAYYSSHGNILLESLDHIQIALVIIHGAGRNADDYLCSATAAVKLQKKYPAQSVLIIVPHFPSVTDDPITLYEGGIPLKWGDDNEWRYGGQAIYPPYANNVSSFDTVDRIMHVLHNRTTLKHVTIAGHSAGGQFAQRWSLLTQSWIPNRMSSAVANPSNYAYLTPLRLLNGTWQIPRKHDCPQYNEWEFGLEKGGDQTMAYKDRALRVLGDNITALMERFAGRRITYLAGGADRCNVSEYERDGWCFSHGLETSCMNMLQGSNRWERNLRYCTSLRRLGIKTHKRWVVSGVGHDHSLIFTSPSGLEALFPNVEEDTTFNRIEYE